ncbi:MAG TPA: MFS transporter [Gemmatimonadaceae bacterium]|nr:MFS transporter [Gemmatimonadaceae bacterium]
MTRLHDPYAALRHRDYRLFLAGRALFTVAEQMLDVSIGWELYERTHSALALGIVGLVLVVPSIVLALPAGHTADRYDRRRIVIAAQGAFMACALALAWLSFARGPVPLIYVCLLAGGVALAFARPAASALLPLLVPLADFPNAVTWNSSAFQVAAVVGPALGGAVIGLRHEAGPAYVIAAGLVLACVACIALLRARQATRPREEVTVRTLAAGLGFVWRSKVILAALTLDLFAVLFGGATTLLPVFAKDILHVGPVGFGWLRAAPSVGALAMAVALTHRAPMRRAGRSLLLAVSGFGAATIVFGLSRSFTLSMVMLFVLGALDNISVVVRGTLVQVRTPDAMRGRVSAVNGVFIDTSNELGGFESGLTAAIFGPVVSVVGGGILTILVVAGVAWAWPELRRMGALHEGAP